MVFLLVIAPTTGTSLMPVPTRIEEVPEGKTEGSERKPTSHQEKSFLPEGLKINGPINAGQ
jgi:hypothetical protein